MEHVQSLRGIYNLKANVIIGIVQTALWGVVGMLIMQANIKKCNGSACVRSWIIAILALIVKYAYPFATPVFLGLINASLTVTSLPTLPLSLYASSASTANTERRKTARLALSQTILLFRGRI